MRNRKNSAVSKPILYILLETKVRELEARVLLGLEASLHGFRVVIGRKGHIKSGINKGIFPPGIVFEKSITHGKENDLEELRKNGCVVVSQDEESGILDYSYEHFLSFRSSPENVETVSAVFCWGQHDQDAWVRRYPQSKEKFHATGSPRVDLWRRDFDPYFQDSVSQLSKEFGSFVLVSSNFAPASSAMSTSARVRQAWKNGSVKSQADEDRLLGKIDDNVRMFGEFVKLVRFLSERFPSRKIVVRPHPAENANLWEDSTRGLENVDVVFRGGMDQWVRAASVIVHIGCTSAIEAYSVGTPAIAYIPFDSIINREVPRAISIRCYDVYEVESTIGEIFSSRFTDNRYSDENEKIIESRLINTRRASTAAYEIVRVLSGISVPWSSHLGSIGSSFFLRLRFAVVKAYKSLRGNSAKSYKKFPGLKRREVTEIRDRLNLVNSAYMNCTVSRLFGDMVVIETRESGRRS